MMETLSINILSKLNGLLYSLTHTKEEIELVADEVEDCNLRSALNCLSMESSHFANEICMQYKMMGLHFPKTSLEELQGANSMPDDENFEGHGDELSYICTKNENFIVAAYRNILNENSLFPGLRDTMVYQLNILVTTFLKVKQLNSARFGSLSAAGFAL